MCITYSLALKVLLTGVMQQDKLDCNGIVWGNLGCLGGEEARGYYEGLLSEQQGNGGPMARREEC